MREESRISGGEIERRGLRRRVKKHGEEGKKARGGRKERGRGGQKREERGREKRRSCWSIYLKALREKHRFQRKRLLGGGEGRGGGGQVGERQVGKKGAPAEEVERWGEEGLSPEEVGAGRRRRQGLSRLRRGSVEERWRKGRREKEGRKAAPLVVNSFPTKSPWIYAGGEE